MFSIRQEQLGALRELSLWDFERRLAAHLHRVWPEKCRLFGVKDVTRSAREGMRRARTCGFKMEYNVTRFVDLTYALGQNFDTDPAMLWADAIPADATLPSSLFV